jgi:hypothetical protein
MRRPGRRFQIGVAVGWVAFVILSLAMGGHAALPLDWLAGACVLIAMTLASFVVWSLVVWGFTLNMLLTLDLSAHPLDLDGWADRYSGGRSVHQICLDRLGVLTMFKLARLQGDEVRLVATTGRVAAATANAVRALFGISSTTR